MYLVIPILIVLIFVLSLSNYHRRKRTIQKISGMSYTKKCSLLNELAEPFGFTYQFVQDIFTSRKDAWQKEFSYGEFYSQTVLSMHMALDCEPVYFNYQGKTWLIEFRKGQYGINTGAEANIYHADSIVPPVLRPQTIFQAAEANESPLIKLRLTGPGYPFFSISEKHWWPSGFVTGIYTRPDDLILEVTVTFPDIEMCAAFTRAMCALGYKDSELLVCHTTIQFYFTSPKATPLIPPDMVRRSYTLFRNSLFCDLYLWITSPFFTTVDRLLYLKDTHPYLFSRTLCLRMFRKHKRKRP